VGLRLPKGLWSPVPKRIRYHYRQGGLVERVVSRLPDRLAARIDALRPGLAIGFGGPLNGQEARIAAVREMFGRLRFDLVVETGTYRGMSTRFLRSLTTARVVTIESEGRYARYAFRSLHDLPDTKVILGDSATEIRRLAAGPRPVSAARPFFYLDAHGEARLPLRWELLEITSGWPTFCALIDDFEVPGDPGYGADDFGPGFRLGVDHLAGLALPGVAAFWPTSPSALETGKRRGWLVLARGDPMTTELRAMPGLREDTSSPIGGPHPV
jgi:hypothetical protein